MDMERNRDIALFKRLASEEAKGTYGEITEGKNPN